jgi:transposase
MPSGVHIHLQLRIVGDNGTVFTDNEILHLEKSNHGLEAVGLSTLVLDRGMSCEEVGRVLLIDDDTIRTWHRLFKADGIDGLTGLHYGGRTSPLSLEQQDKLKRLVGETLPRTTRVVGAWIEHAFGIVYENRSGLIAQLHCLGMEHRKPQAASRIRRRTRLRPTGRP